MADFIVKPFTDRGFSVSYLFKAEGSLIITVQNDVTGEIRDFRAVKGEDITDVAQNALAWADQCQTWEKMYSGIFNGLYQYSCETTSGDTVFVTRGSERDQIILCHSDQGFIYKYPKNANQLYFALRDYAPIEAWSKTNYA